MDGVHVSNRSIVCVRLTNFMVDKYVILPVFKQEESDSVVNHLNSQNSKGSRKKVYVSRLNFERFWRLLCYLYRISVAFSVKYNI